LLQHLLHMTPRLGAADTSSYGYNIQQTFQGPTTTRREQSEHNKPRVIQHAAHNCNTADSVHCPVNSLLDRSNLVHLDQI